MLSASTGETTSWVKGNKVRVEGVGINPSGDKARGEIINDGEWVYIWGGKDKTGTKYQISAVETREWEENIKDWQDPQKGFKQ